MKSQSGLQLLVPDIYNKWLYLWWHWFAGGRWSVWPALGWIVPDRISQVKKLDFLQSEDEYNFARPDFLGGESSINSERNEDDYLRSG